MHKEILSEKQKELLPLIRQFSREYYLAGGTAVALHIGHRRSIDFDLFKDEIIKAARKYGCKVITSYHDFVKTPVMRELEQVLNWCLESSPDIAKISCRVNSIEDNARLLSIYSLNKNVISIGMGELGRITRIAATLLGAPFTYAANDKSRRTAPGQIDASTLKNIISMMSEA